MSPNPAWSPAKLPDAGDGSLAAVPGGAGATLFPSGIATAEAMGSASVSVAGLSGFNTAVPAWFTDTETMTLTGTAPNQYYAKSPFARVDFQLPGTSTAFTIEAVALGSGVLDTVGVWTTTDPTGAGLTYNQVATFTNYGVKQQIAITLPVGTRWVQLAEQARITGVSAASYSVVSVPATVPYKIYSLGDSIGAGNSANPLHKGYLPDLFRHCGIADSVTIAAVSGDSLFAQTANGTSVTALAAKIVAGCAQGSVRRVAYIELVTNDFGLDYWTHTAFGTKYGQVLDAVHASDPTIQFVIQTAFHRSSEATPQPVNGSVLSQFNTVIQGLATGRSAWVTVIDGYQAITLAEIGAAGGLHPDTAQHVKIANWLREQFGQLNPIAASATAVATAPVTYVAPVTTLQSKLRADTGITSTGASPDKITAISDAGALGSTWVMNASGQGPEKTTNNGHAAMLFAHSVSVESLKPSLAASSWAFAHKAGFTGVWRIKRTAATNGYLYDETQGDATRIGLVVRWQDAGGVIIVQVSNGTGTFAFSLNSSASALPAVGTAATIDLRFTVAGGLVLRVNKTIVGTIASPTGSLSASAPSFAPWVGALAGGVAPGGDMYLFEQQLHGPVSADTALSDAALNAIVDQMATDWP